MRSKGLEISELIRFSKTVEIESRPALLFD